MTCGSVYTALYRLFKLLDLSLAGPVRTIPGHDSGGCLAFFNYTDRVKRFTERWWVSLMSGENELGGNPGGLNRSVQHWLAVYSPEFQSPRSFAGVDSGAELPC